MAGSQWSGPVRTHIVQLVCNPVPRVIEHARVGRRARGRAVERRRRSPLQGARRARSAVDGQDGRSAGAGARCAMADPVGAESSDG